jgi:hypothetical protein
LCQFVTSILHTEREGERRGMLRDIGAKERGEETTRKTEKQVGG